MTSRPQPAVDPAAYLDLATELASRPEPYARRTAADRAYYSAFLYGRDQLANKGYITPYNSIEDHKYVAETLKDCLGAVGNDEHRLRSARNKITYDTGVLLAGDRDVRSVEWMISTAGDLIRRVEALPKCS